MCGPSMGFLGMQKMNKEIVVIGGGAAGMMAAIAAAERGAAVRLLEPNEREILSIMRRNGEEYSAKLLIKAINLEKVLHDKKKASVSPTKETTDAQNTAGIGRCGDYTTAPRQIQGGI